MRELAYEMIRVVNNVNVRFNEGYFGWVKFELEASKIAEFEAPIKLDSQVVRFLVVKTVRENTIFTKRAPVVKIESLAGNEDDTTIDATGTTEVTPETEAPKEVEVAEEAK
jgi:hypothetical protein